MKIVKYFFSYNFERVTIDELDEQFLKINALSNEVYIIVILKDGRIFSIINGESVIINENNLYRMSGLAHKNKTSV